MSEHDAKERIFVAQSMGKSFGRDPVLKNATLWADGGRIVALMGRNGCGKTTLLKVAVGFLRADFGAVRLDGEATARPSPARMSRQGVFFSPQDGCLLPNFSVGSHLRMAATRSSSALEAAVVRLRLEELLELRPHQLSGGERKRAEMALAMTLGPRVLLVDEPLAGLAPFDRDLGGEVLREMATGGAAVVVTGHDAPELFALADRIDWMAAGTTHRLGTPEQALKHDQFVREYLGPAGRRRVRAKLAVGSSPSSTD